MKKLIIFIMSIILLTGCVNKYGNDVSKLETTIISSNGHDTYVIEEGFNIIKNEFENEDTFYHASLLTIEYDKNDIEEEIKNKLNAYEVLYLTFTFKTGNVEYAAMQSNYVYEYETILVKYTENDVFNIYLMDGINY